MKKSPCVTFKMLRIAEGDWQIVAECPGMEAPLRPIPVCASRSDSDNLTDLQMFARQTFDRRHNRRARLTVVVFVTDHSTPVRLGTTTTISRFPHELSQEARVLRLTLLAPDRSRACSPGFATAYPRVSNDTPSVNAFCCVAPAVRFSDFAILATGISWRARVFSSRTSSLVHSRRFAFFAIFTGSDVLGAAY